MSIYEDIAIRAQALRDHAEYLESINDLDLADELRIEADELEYAA